MVLNLELSNWKKYSPGRPLYHFIYIIVWEAFIGLVNHVEQEGRIHGIQITRSTPAITNLCIAIDTIVFCKASVEEATTLNGILEDYAVVSGQVVIFEKSY